MSDNDFVRPVMLLKRKGGQAPADYMADRAEGFLISMGFVGCPYPTISDGACSGYMAAMDALYSGIRFDLLPLHRENPLGGYWCWPFWSPATRQKAAEMLEKYWSSRAEKGNHNVGCPADEARLLQLMRDHFNDPVLDFEDRGRLRMPQSAI